MVTTYRPPGPDPWDAPWVTPEVRAAYSVTDREPEPLLDVNGDDVRDETPTTRSSRDAAQEAIFEATGTRVDLAVRPERSEEFDSTPLDADSSDTDPFGWDDDREAVAIRTAEAHQDTAERRAKRNARDRSRRLKAFKAKVRRGVTHHGPEPRGA